MKRLIFLLFFLITFVNAFNILPLYRYWNCVGFSNDIKSNEVFKFNVGDIPLVAWKTDENKIVTTLNGCKHLGSKLEDGWIDDGCLVCPYHGVKHSWKDSCGELVEHDNKLWWSYNPIDKLPPSIPYNKSEYTKTYFSIDMDESLPYCAYNSMDLNHPEFIHNGITGFGSSDKPTNFKTHLSSKQRIGIEFEYIAKDNIKAINYDGRIDNMTKNFNQFIYPSTTWSRVSFNKNSIIVGVSMLPIKKDKTRWYITVKHNYMNDLFGENIVKMMTMIILKQDQEQFKRQIKNSVLKEHMTLRKVLHHDEPILYMRDFFKGYKYPLIEDFLEDII